MAFDGIVLSNILTDFKKLLIGGRIDKIYQPEIDEIVFTVRNNRNNYRVLMTSHSSHPRIHFTTQTKSNPSVPPTFCMFLRKHIAGGKILDITQPNFERIIEIHVESTNELGDLVTKKLIIEIMGRHSNIILINSNGKIMDSIKHITHQQSSIREVLPGRSYTSPPSHNKHTPLTSTKQDFIEALNSQTNTIQKIIYTTYCGISPLIAGEICHRANIDCSSYPEILSDYQKESLYNNFHNIFQNIKQGNYNPTLYMNPNTRKIVTFSSITLTEYSSFIERSFSDISSLLEHYYFERNNQTRMHQKTSDVRKILQTHLERCYRKKDIQILQLKEVKNREKHRIFGELITANIYSIPQGASSFTTINYYDESMGKLDIPLKANLSPAENAQKYFKKYNKAKRTEIAAKQQLLEINSEILYLQSLLTMLELCQCDDDLKELRSELMEQGYIRFRKTAKNSKKRLSKPMHFISSDGFDIYVGKNNNQNDRLTLKTANNNDLWLHTKDIPGSHVVIKSVGKQIPKQTLLEAAHLSAYYSKGQNSSNVPVDYTYKKHVRKPSGAKPGMVIYDSQKTIYITPDSELVNQIHKA